MTPEGWLRPLRPFFFLGERRMCVRERRETIERERERDQKERERRNKKKKIKK